jgi:hypothetical protein
LAERYLEAQWLQWSRLSAFKEPARANAQTMVPRWQPRGVHCKSRLAREWASHNLAGGENGGVLCAETECFPEFNEVFCFQFFAVQKRADIASAKVSLLKRELRRAGECRSNVGIESDVAERESILVSADLQRTVDDD